MIQMVNVENLMKEFCMKKILCAVLAFVSSLGFTQELKFDGYLNSGLGFVLSDSPKGPAKFQAYGVDSERNFGRFRFNGAYTGESENAGVNFRLQLQGNKDTAGSNAYNIPLLPYAYGWFKPLDILTIKGGLVDDSTWETAGWFKDDQGEGVGILVKLNMAGMDIGVGAFTASQLGSSDNNKLGVDPGAAVDWDSVKYTFNFAYTMPEVFRIMLSGRTWNQSGNNTSPHALAEFRLLAVKGITAILEVEADKLNKDYGSKGDLNFFETFSWKTGSLGLGLNAAEFFSMDSAKTDPGLEFNPWVSYALAEGSIVPRLDVVFFLGGEANGNNYHRKYNAFKANYDFGDYVFSARPSVKFALNSKTSVEIGDAFFYQKKTGSSGMTNVFYTDLVVKF
jgi:hypothetical protein